MSLLLSTMCALFYTAGIFPLLLSAYAVPRQHLKDQGGVRSLLKAFCGSLQNGREPPEQSKKKKSSSS